MDTLPSRAKLIKTIEIEFQYDVQLYKTGKMFAVVYGADIRTNLDYNQACTEFGHCVFHALQCNGKID